MMCYICTKSETPQKRKGMISCISNRLSSNIIRYYRKATVLITLRAFNTKVNLHAI
jgi:hypothetical protein